MENVKKDISQIINCIQKDDSDGATEKLRDVLVFKVRERLERELGDDFGSR